MTPIIEVTNLSKQYRLGTIGTGTVSHDLNRWWHQVRGKEDPYLKIGQADSRAQKGDNEYVWSLKDINFTVNAGEVLGIIGKNGAGKSTLLKILSKVTAPTTGTIKMRGRVASLLEVGTGFHPELTGRENVFLNGAILGMTKSEIKSKFDEIVDFSGVEKYIDTPVKRYSSGMYVRLAFAVAAHLEPEILIVDEVLAVGDAEFQKKCLGKMKDVSVNDGRTVLFVSHNMAAVKSLCNHAILLEKGQINCEGSTDNVVRKYLGGDAEHLNFRQINQSTEGFTLISFGIRNKGSSFSDILAREKEIQFEINYSNHTNQEGLYFNVKIKDDEGKYFLVTTSINDAVLIENGINKTAIMNIPAGYFNEGQFSIDLMVLSKDENGYRTFYNDTDLLTIQVQPDQRQLGTWMGKEVGFIIPTFYWTIND